MDIKKTTIEKLLQTSETRWGKWTRYIIGAIIGALTAAGILTITTGCTTTAGLSLSSDQGTMTLTRDATTGTITVSILPPIPQITPGKK